MALPAYHAHSTTPRRILGCLFDPKTQVVSSHSWGSGKPFGFEVLNCWQEEIDKLLGCTSSSLLMAIGYQNVSSRTRVTNPTCLFAYTVILETSWDRDTTICHWFRLFSVHLSTSWQPGSWKSLMKLLRQWGHADPTVETCLTYLPNMEENTLKYGRKMCKLRSEIHQDVLRTSTRFYKILQVRPYITYGAVRHEFFGGARIIRQLRWIPKC